MYHNVSLTMHFRRIIYEMTRSFIDHSIIGWVNLIEMWANPTWRIWYSSSLHVPPSLTCWTLASVEEQIQHTHSHWCPPISLSSLGYKSVISPRMPHSTDIHSYSVCYSLGTTWHEQGKMTSASRFSGTEIMWNYGIMRCNRVAIHRLSQAQVQGTRSQQIIEEDEELLICNLIVREEEHDSFILFSCSLVHVL